MKPLVSENHARLTYLKRELVKSVTTSRYFKVKTCRYDPPKRAIPARVKKLIKEIDDLEKEIGGDGEVLRRQSKNYIPW